MKTENVITSLIRRAGRNKVIAGVICFAIGAVGFNFLLSSYFMLFIFSVLLLVGVINVVIGIINLALPHKHRAVREAEKLDGIENIERYIESSEYNGEILFNAKDLLVSKRYIIGKEGGVRIFRTEDLMWAYHTRTTHRTNGIKTGTSHQLTLVFCGQKKRYQFVLMEDKIQECLELIGKSLPYVYLGYSDQLDNYAKTSKTEFEKEWRDRKDGMRIM